MLMTRARARREASMKSPTQILGEEHEEILAVLDALERVVHCIEAGGTVPLQVLADFHEFFTVFADRCHHGREEELLFPFLERKGIPRAGGPLGCMLAEHDEGRGYMRLMAQNAQGCAEGDVPARNSWCEAARGYANLLRNHIWKENEILFRMAECVISPEEQAALGVQFAKVEKAKIGAATLTLLREKMENLLRQNTMAAR
jgi:hemerythrin-like domain-containing protein